MARLSFDFNLHGKMTLSFDPEEFRGLDYADIKDAIRNELPGTVDNLDVITAAKAIYERLVETEPRG